jgi:hypothetical protein
MRQGDYTSIFGVLRRPSASRPWHVRAAFDIAKNIQSLYESASFEFDPGIMTIIIIRKNAVTFYKTAFPIKFF